MEGALVLLLLVLVLPVAALTTAVGAERRMRDAGRRQAPRRPAPGECDNVSTLAGCTLFAERLDSWSIGVDCLLAPVADVAEDDPSPDGAALLPVGEPLHLRLYCPLVQWHQTTILVSAMVESWLGRGDPLTVQVRVPDGRPPRARLACRDSAVVLDVENGGAVRGLLRRASLGGLRTYDS